MLVNQSVGIIPLGIYGQSVENKLFGLCIIGFLVEGEIVYGSQANKCYFVFIVNLVFILGVEVGIGR